MESNTDWRDSCPTNRDKAHFMYKNNLRTDCAFVVGEGKEKKVFRAHTFILVSVSAVFDAMFYSDVGQDRSNICIPDIHPEVFQAFLNAIYLENVTPTSFKEASDLLCVASKYMVKTVQDQCLSYIAANIMPSNAARGYEVLSLYDHTELASSFWKLIQEDTAQVLASEDFTDVGKETLVRILSEDELFVESEGELVSAVQRWVDADLQRHGLTEDADRLALLSEFLPYIRFMSMSAKEFFSIPDRTSLFSYQDYDSVLNRIIVPESTASLPPNVCSKKRIFLPKVPLPEDWKKQLKRAAVDGDVFRLRRLQAAGADLSLRYEQGMTLLHMTAEEGHAECMRWLLEQGLPVDSPDNSLFTPLHYAAEMGRLEIVRLLLDSGADPAARPRDRRTALDLAISYKHSAVAALLISRT